MDIEIYESGDGGEMSIQNDDLALSSSLLQTAYLALFGGNTESSTRGDELPEQYRNDYWANTLLFKTEKEKQFNSETERTLNEVALNSSGRQKIVNSIKSDLKVLDGIATYNVEVSIQTIDKVSIFVQVNELGNGETRSFQIIYDVARREIITQILI